MKKGIKTFLTIGGIYLLLLTGLLLTQPKSGHPPSIEQILLYILLFAPLWLVIFGVFTLSRKHPESKLTKWTSNKNTLYLLLIVLVIAGFVFNLDYLRQIGCFVENERACAPMKLVLSGSSLFLLTVGFLYSNRKFGISVLMAEFVLWTGKSLYHNDSLDPIVPGYFTMICWTIRYGLIAILINEIEKNEPLTMAKKS